MTYPGEEAYRLTKFEEYDIVVGSSQQVADDVATHTVSDFVAAISNGDKILILDGTHTLVRNEEEAAAEEEVMVGMEDPVKTVAALSSTEGGI